MSEAEGKVRLEYQIEGIDESTSAQSRLEASLADVAAVLESSKQSLADYEQAQVDAADAGDTLTAAAVESGFALGEMREKASSAIGALGTLSSMLGTESDAGALVGRMSHFGQLGMQVGGIFGPAGAVVGSIVGAFIPALDELTGGLDGVSESTDRAARAVASYNVNLLAAAHSARDLATAQRNADADIALASSRNLGDRQRASDDAIAVRRTELQSQISAIAQTARTSDGARQENAELRLRFVRGQLDEIENEISEREQQARTVAARAEEARSAVGSTGSSAGASSGGSGGAAAREGPEFDEARYLSEFRVGLIDEQEARELARIERVKAAEMSALGLHREMVARDQAEADENAQKAVQEQSRIAAEALERQESKRLAVKRRQEADTRMWRGTQESMLDATLGGANAIGGAFANAFGAAIQGQEDFGTAFVKGMKIQLIQFGVGQVAEGAGALLSAVGLAFTNPPAAAGKAVEGAGKIALGVSLGAAGAAISVPSSGAGDERAPRMGPAANEGTSGGNVIVNMNSPFVTAGTQAELGRGLTRSIGMSQRRFGRAA